MYKFGNKSKAQLDTLHPKLKIVLEIAIKSIDFSIIEGLRDQYKQTEYYSTKKSKLQWPLSRHNRTNDHALDASEFTVSDAVDIVPYPTQYSDKEQMILLAGHILGVASILGIKLRWGGDWNSNGIINNKRDDFFDCWHFEIIHD